MKAYKYIIATVVLALACSCSEFLEYRDKDKVIPETLTHYNELVFGEVLNKTMGRALLDLEFMSDDIGSYGENSSSPTKKDARLDYISYYTWAKEPQINGVGDEKIDQTWEKLYQKILMCNIIENNVGNIVVTLSEEIATQKRLIAEVQCVRAICYYYLLNTYGDVYQSATQATQAMGVPINNEIGITANAYVRSTLAEVCEKIEEDLNVAEANFKIAEHKNTIFRPNAELVLLMKSRLYLMMHRYDDVISVCDQLLASTSKTIASADFVKATNSNSPFLSKENTGILFSWWNREGFYTSWEPARYVCSESLINSFDAEDLRSNAFFGSGSYMWYKKDYRNKWTTYSTCLVSNFRIEEAYFNKVEAMLKKSPESYADALSIVNEVRAQRITAKGKLLTATSKEEAWTVFKAEKRREFCFEDMRWFDIRRWGERITHIHQNFNNPAEYVTYVLESNSPNYVMALPFDVIRLNDKIEQPKRIDSKTIPNE